jgi:hypothetical protein
MPATPLPRLVAILSNATDGGVLRTAVFGDADDVLFATAGDSVGGFVVSGITSDSAVLVDRASGSSFGLSLH